MPLPETDRFTRLVESGFAERARPDRPSLVATSWAMAAAAALAVTGIGGYWYGSANPGVGGSDLMTIAQGDPLHVAISETPSGQVAQLGHGASLTPVLSFQSADGQFCREVEFDSAASAAVGIVCRDDAMWRTVVLMQSNRGAGSGGGFATVGDPPMTGIEDAYARLQGGEPLSLAAERALIDAGWRR